MTDRIAVRLLKLTSGERLPVLVNTETGLPLHEPLLYVLTEYRARNLSTSTIDQVLRAISFLLTVLAYRQVDLAERLGEGRLLSLSEIDELVRLARLKQEALSIALAPATPTEAKVLRIEQARMPRRAQQQLPEVVSAANRIRLMRDYLCWLVRAKLSAIQGEHPHYAALLAVEAHTREAFDARVPPEPVRSVLNQREGLPPEAAEYLLKVIRPVDANNPWKGEHTRHRNELIVLWMYYLGLRRGELLNLRVSDINFQKEEVTVVRRADDPADPRIDQPRVKTRDRIVPISAGLATLTQNYVLNHRRHIPGAGKNPYLFVASNGKPLSLSMLNKLFDQLKAANPALLAKLSPHVLRHTWNDNFSEAMDASQIQEAQEQQMRAYLMGWSPTSKTAAIYTRRHVREKAKKASLALQAACFSGAADAEI